MQEKKQRMKQTDKQTETNQRKPCRHTVSKWKVLMRSSKLFFLYFFLFISSGTECHWRLLGVTRLPWHCQWVESRWGGYASSSSSSSSASSSVPLVLGRVLGQVGLRREGGCVCGWVGGCGGEKRLSKWRWVRRMELRAVDAHRGICPKALHRQQVQRWAEKGSHGKNSMLKKT